MPGSPIEKTGHISYPRLKPSYKRLSIRPRIHHQMVVPKDWPVTHTQQGPPPSRAPQDTG
ncbi:hypothetical protein EBZ35_04655 [bacterium]|nr:hypothetical protein [bacterium]